MLLMASVGMSCSVDLTAFRINITFGDGSTDNSAAVNSTCCNLVGPHVKYACFRNSTGIYHDSSPMNISMAACGGSRWSKWHGHVEVPGVWEDITITPLLQAIVRYVDSTVGQCVFDVTGCCLLDGPRFGTRACFNPATGMYQDKFANVSMVPSAQDVWHGHVEAAGVWQDITIIPPPRLGGDAAQMARQR